MNKVEFRSANDELLTLEREGDLLIIHFQLEEGKSAQLRIRGGEANEVLSWMKARGA